ncbi:MAG: hypothetical protein HW421_1381 [Ignavibacteria bacterium]|nr:hypothetical protein [Ignavibacteria bacterium]
MFSLKRVKQALDLTKFFMIMCFAGTTAFADIELGSEFNSINAKYASGYFKPLFTSIGQSFNTNLFTTAKYKKEWSFGIDFSVQAMMIPSSQLTFNAPVPDTMLNKTTYIYTGSGTNTSNNRTTITQPTIYGGKATPLFSASTTETFVEGFNISNISGIPNIQFILGIPTQTEIRFRGAGFGDLFFLGFNINQQIDQFFKIFGKDEIQAIAVNLAYHSISYSKAFDMSSLCFGARYSRELVEGLNVYGGVLYETLSGKFEATYKNPDDPNFKKFKIDIETFSNIRLLLGLTYRISFFEAHFDAAYASQPTIAGGISFWFF